MQAVVDSELLMLPARFENVNEDEMEYLNGGVGVAAILGIVATVISLGGATYQGGKIAGERAYYAGLRNSTYQKWKWQIRGAAVAAGSIAGGIFMLGFENQFYSMI